MIISYDSRRKFFLFHFMNIYIPLDIKPQLALFLHPFFKHLAPQKFPKDTIDDISHRRTAILRATVFSLFRREYNNCTTIGRQQPGFVSRRYQIGEREKTTAAIYVRGYDFAREERPDDYSNERQR